MNNPIHVTIEDETYACQSGTSLEQLVAQHLPQLAAQVLAVEVDGRAKGLRWQPQRDCQVKLLTYQDEEARRMYERSARFLFLLALRDVLPGARVRIEHSAGYGVYIQLLAPHMAGQHLARRLTQRMGELVEQDAAFVRERWTREEAMAYFEAEGQQDKLRLLVYRPYGHFDVYTCLGMSEYFYGEMLPSTGYLRQFALCYYLPGLVLQLPDPQDMGKVPALQQRPQLMRTYAEAARWGKILGLSNAADLNDVIAAGRLREMIRISEVLHQRDMDKIAEDSMRRGARLVLIAGPSSSGKTTFTNRLSVQLKAAGLKPVSISLDNYYLDRDKVPLNDQGQPDLECLESLDVKLFNEQLLMLLAGEAVEVPRFSFGTGARKPQGQLLQVRADQPILIEGIHGINPRLTADIPDNFKYKIYISALTNLNLDDHNRIRTTDVRLLRRLVRDRQFRSSPLERTFDMWDDVRAGEEKYIFPYQEQADAMFNSSLLYELSILKKYAYPMLREVSESSPWYLRAQRLIKFLNYFVVGEAEDEIPPTSLLREFIGGCTFYMD